MAEFSTDHSDIILDGGTASWNINQLGNIGGMYIGTFRFRCYLSPTRQIAANREYRELMGANPTMAPEKESFLAYALTQLKHRILDSPPFWASAVGLNGLQGDLEDEDILTSILDAAIASEVKYKRSLTQKRVEVLDRAKKAAEAILKRSEEAELDDLDGEE